MLQNRVDGLATIFIVPDYASKFDMTEFVLKFAKKKGQKMRF